MLAGIDLTAQQGQVVGLLGPNGSGKTTLLRTLYASLRPSAGAVHLDGRDVAALGARQIAREVAVVVQEHSSDLPLRVADMVLLGRTPHRGTFERHRAEDHRIAADALARVGVAHLAGRQYAELSGGEKQRVLIARALTQQATHLLLDEPTNHLDIRYQHEILDLVRGLESTSVVVLHDLNLAALYCDQVALLHDGQVVAAGTPHEVLTPEILEPVYEVGVRRIPLGEQFQLAFRPHPSPHQEKQTA
ncbi:ABC transporter ATP-binding protein [Rhodococcus sp. X156]|uniref:ABC transporter ATP-binding protein n=1 Tax=Rhodococcus sp. X156 TaxID=2499145 RepID=UPI001F49F2A4|nr:ABC transporter ATP-binding protein [Rhodococcus sp. X156]